MHTAALAATSDDLLQQALDLARGGRAAEMRRDLSGALSLYEQAQLLLVEVGPTPLHANLLRWSGSVLRDLGKVEDADRLYTDSFSMADRTGATGAKAAALNCRAVIAQRRGDHTEAVALYRRAARLAAEAGEIRLVGMIQQNLGVLANIRGELREAFRRYRAALSAFLEVSDDEAVSWVLNNTGMFLTDLGRPRRAQRCFLAALDIAVARRDRPMVGVLQANYAECLIAMRRWADADMALERALELARSGEDRAREAEALKLQGVLDRERGFPKAAGKHFSAALEIAHRIGDRLLAAEVLAERGDLHARLEWVDNAVADWSRAREGFLAQHAARDAERMSARIEALRSAMAARTETSKEREA
jgi:tetratricopeptide (TPR) repeat protein